MCRVDFLLLTNVRYQIEVHVNKNQMVNRTLGILKHLFDKNKSENSFFFLLLQTSNRMLSIQPFKDDIDLPFRAMLLIESKTIFFIKFLFMNTQTQKNCLIN